MRGNPRFHAWGAQNPCVENLDSTLPGEQTDSETHADRSSNSHRQVEQLTCACQPGFLDSTKRKT